MLFMLLRHRFDIIEQYGCRPITYPSVLAGSYSYSRYRGTHLCRTSSSAVSPSPRTSPPPTPPSPLPATSASSSYSPYKWSGSSPSPPTISGSPSPPSVHTSPGRTLLAGRAVLTIFIPQEVETMYCAAWWVAPASTAIFVALFAFRREAVEDCKHGFACVGSGAGVARRTALQETGDGNPKEKGGGAFDGALSGDVSQISYQ
ncbi:hypothetical protein K438DRAFT_2028027 [Mycena galopus ATCC 62051]|nr:hypothetical protein K438DRAFT_2028027 [Mycena galopus ATCC 62051]